MSAPTFLTYHYMPREMEILLGIILTIIGIWLLWLAFDAQGRKMPWPFSGFMPV